MDAPYHELLLAAAGSELGFNSLIQRFSSMLYSHAYGILLAFPFEFVYLCRHRKLDFV